MSNSAAADAKKQPPGNKLFAEHLDLLERRRFLIGGGDDLCVEDRAGGLDRGKLKIFFRAEVGVEAALAHSDVVGEAADRESFETVDGCQFCGRVQDRAPAPLAV